MTVYNAGNIYLEDLNGGTTDQIHIYAQTDNIADGAVTDAKLAQTGGVLSSVQSLLGIINPAPYMKQSTANVTYSAWAKRTVLDGYDFQYGFTYVITLKFESAITEESAYAYVLNSNGDTLNSGPQMSGLSEVSFQWTPTADASNGRIAVAFSANGSKSNIETTVNVVTYVDDFTRFSDSLDELLKDKEYVPTVGKFIRGGLANGAFNVGTKYRVSSAENITAEHGTLIKADAGFKFSLHKYANGTYTDTGWKTICAVHEGEVYKMLIARETEDSSEVADINYFVSKIHETALLAPKFMKPGRLELIAHQGGISGLYTRNTVKNAVYNVLNNGVDNVELDVKFTSDDVIVVYHDETFTYNGVTYTIADTSSDIVLEAGIDLFESFVTCAKRYGFKLTIDLGGAQWTDSQILSVVNIVKDNSMVYDSWFISGRMDMLYKVIDKCPAASVGLICFSRPNQATTDFLIGLAQSVSGSVFVDLQHTSAITSADAEYIGMWRSGGVQVGAFTFGESQQAMMLEFANMVDCITTDIANARAVVNTYDF